MNEFLNRFSASLQIPSNNYLKEIFQEGIDKEITNKKLELAGLLTIYANSLSDGVRVSILKTQGTIETLNFLLTITQRKGKTDES